MVVILILLFIIVATLAILENEEEYTYKTYVYWGLAIILVAIAGLREVGLDHDSENYEYIFTHSDPDVFELLEPSYLFISYILSFFTDDIHVLFLVYACLGVLVKMKAIKELTPLYFLPIIVYLGNYFMLHEMTQIRAGVAASMLLMSIRPMTEGRKWVATGWLLIALLFHFSSIVLFPLLFLSTTEMSFRSKLIWGSTIPAVYLLYLVHLDPFHIIPIPAFSEKIEIYQELKDKGIAGEDIFVFNYLQLFRIAIFYYTLYFYDVIKQYNKYLPLLTKMMAISIASYVFLSGIPILAIRVSELFGIVDIIMFVNLYYTLKPSYVVKGIIVLLAAALFYLDVFSIGLFDPSKAP